MKEMLIIATVITCCQTQIIAYQVMQPFDPFIMQLSDINRQVSTHYSQHIKHHYILCTSVSFYFHTKI